MALPRCSTGYLAATDEVLVSKKATLCILQAVILLKDSSLEKKVSDSYRSQNSLVDTITKFFPATKLFLVTILLQIFIVTCMTNDLHWNRHMNTFVRIAKRFYNERK